MALLCSCPQPRRAVLTHPPLLICRRKCQGSREIRCWSRAELALPSLSLHKVEARSHVLRVLCVPVISLRGEMTVGQMVVISTWAMEIGWGGIKSWD